MNATFNPATFCTSTLTDAQFKRMEQRDDIDHSPRVDAGVAVMIGKLEQAAARFALRRDSFATGKSATCLDIAAKLSRFGSFASPKQAEFAEKLVTWSLPRAQEGAQKAPGSTQAAPVVLPRLHALMQRLSKLQIGRLTVARANGDSLCWIKYENHSGVIGKIERDGSLHLFAARIPAGTDGANAKAELLRIEADPEAAAVLHGKASGRCSICSRDLTDPKSIERGIGPVCDSKAGW